jgi:hypothetical protein
MAEAFLSKDQFEEFTKRMEQGFDPISQQNASIQADIRQMHNWIIGLYGIVVFGFIGSIFITMIKKNDPIDRQTGPPPMSPADEEGV